MKQEIINRALELRNKLISLNNKLHSIMDQLKTETNYDSIENELAKLIENCDHKDVSGISLSIEQDNYYPICSLCGSYIRD